MFKVLNHPQHVHLGSLQSGLYLEGHIVFTQERSRKKLWVKYLVGFVLYIVLSCACILPGAPWV